MVNVVLWHQWHVGQHMPNCADVFKSFGKSSKHEPAQLLTREWFIVLIVQCCVDRLLFMIGIMVEIWRTEQPIRWPVTLTLWSAYLVSMVTVTWPNHEASSNPPAGLSCLLFCVSLLQPLYFPELVLKANKDDSRDFLFYLAVANYRLKVWGLLMQH